MSDCKKDILLLGGGYTLKRLAAELGPDRLVLTHRSPESVAASIRNGFSAELVDLDRKETIIHLFDKHPQLRLFVDSVPPMAEENGGNSAAGVTNFLEIIAERRVPIAGGIYLSTTGVYGGEIGDWVDESSPLAPISRRSENRVHCEQVYEKANFPVLRARLSGIYGPGRGVESMIRGGYFRMLPGRWSNRIHVDDIVLALKLLLQKHEPNDWPNILNFSDSEPSKIEEVIGYYCEKLNLPEPPRMSHAELTAESFQRLNQRVSNRRLLDFLGISLRYPSYREALL